MEPILHVNLKIYGRFIMVVLHPRRDSFISFHCDLDKGQSGAAAGFVFAEYES